MQSILFAFLIFFSLVLSQCPLPGYDFNPNTFFEASFATGFRVYVTCGGIATGINSNGGGVTPVALYSDNGNHPDQLLATSDASTNDGGVYTMNFATPVSVSAGYYWIFTGGGTIVPGCLGCSAVANQQVFGVYGVDALESSYADVNFDYFGVGQLGYSLWLDVSTGTPCNFEYDCASSGAGYGFATCVNGFCACQPNFAGAAIPADVCNCDAAAGNQLAYDQNGNPNCLSPGVCQVGTLVEPNLCSGYTQNYEFITCNNGVCQCLDGFQGSATASDQCRCDYTLTWPPSGPVCTNDNNND